MRRCTVLLSLFCVMLPDLIHAADRPVFVGETLLPDSLEPSRYWNPETAPEKLWQRALIEMRLFEPNTAPTSWNNSDCRYDTALHVLQQIRRELGASDNYQQIWAANQAQVLDTCEGRTEQTALIEPTGKQLPQRAASDYVYQLASWHFYRREYASALALYQQVEAMPTAPMQGLAAYMTLRCIAAQGQVDAAYLKAEQLLKQPLADRELVANYRFILMNNTSRYKAPSSELAGQHLNWLLQVIQQSPEKAADLQRSHQDMQDAAIQLQMYFVRTLPDLGVDWWLQDIPAPTARLQAVQEQAKSNELVDWLQARAAANVLAADWIWALHQPDAPYWKDNRAIVEHAWQRWQQTGHAEWLSIAVSRVHPNDPLAPDIAASSEARLQGNWKGETLEYRRWLYELWTHALRLRIGRNDLADAMDLVRNHSDYEQLLSSSTYSSEPPPPAYSAALRWLVYQGRTDEARQWLELMLERDKGSYKQWRLLLAERWQDVTAAALLSGNDSTYRTTDNALTQWEAILQLLPARQLHELALDERVHPYYRPALARAALTRGILLESDNDTLDTYATQVGKLAPELRELVMQFSAKRDHDAYVDLLLRVPRMRPLPNAEYDSPYREVWPRLDLPKDPTAIDTYNHNDNNWWCRVDPAELEEQVFASVKIVPAAMRAFFDTQDLEQQPDVAAYLAKQRQLMANHPYHQQVDQEELKALAAIPAAPQYLSEAVNARERFTDLLPTRDNEARNEHAANLSRAIRTTRYGCQRDGSHAAYSKRSFVLLKQYYGDTLWAKATPFWFGCSHFRGGCPVPEPARE